MGPAELAQSLNGMPVLNDPRLTVGFDSSDDAAVFQISPDTALISTVDFFPPVVGDPYHFGLIAAANALSDVYAMGGQALYALNLVCFPQDMDKDILGRILRGGAEKVAEAGAILCGGHSIYDPEPKYGLAVTGRAHPDKILRNNTCRSGDALILTKPLGVGLVMNAVRAGVAAENEYQAALSAMERLNRSAAEKMDKYPVSAATDVTGFGLLVHALEMAGEDKTMTLNFDSLPVLPGALAHAAAFLVTAAGQRNRNHSAGQVDLTGVGAAGQELLFDPQTSGGLLISVPQEYAEDLCADIQKDDPAAAIIGLVGDREEFSVTVL